MALSVFDLFKVGIGPSSSHTVGPMRAARWFSEALQKSGELDRVCEVRVELFGSLGATGHGHGSDKAVLLGLEGEDPETVDVASIDERLARLRERRELKLAGLKPLRFNEGEHLIMHKRKCMPHHPNGMKFFAFDEGGNVVREGAYYSVGGGFVVDEKAASGEAPIVADNTQISYPFTTGKEILEICKRENISIGQMMMANECCWRPEEEVRAGILKIWEAMQECVRNGCRNRGILPGGLKVKRRAAALYQTIKDRPQECMLDEMDWINLYALAVNEENAAGGRVVTAPTNGAAGIVPAVLHYYWNFCDGNEDGVVRFMLTAAAIGILFKINASISGAEVGCQGEVGSACSMASGGLAEVMGGTPEQVENAAEIGMEHNLGLTCDPIGGLVQIPCIERNAMASVKAVNACRLAMRGDGTHIVSLDKVIKTMKATGEDMKTKYKETARGGLAVHVLEVPVNMIGC